MIVGLKKRTRSPRFYDLAVLDRVEEKTHIITLYRNEPEPKGRVCRTWLKSYAIVRAFNSERWGSNHFWVPLQLIKPVCDMVEPMACKNEDCKFKFICFTSSTKDDIHDTYDGFGYQGRWYEYAKSLSCLITGNTGKMDTHKCEKCELRFQCFTESH